MHGKRYIATLAVGYRFHDLAFAYDLVGNLLSLENRALPPGTFSGPGLGNAIGGPWLKTYVYDDLYRLTSSTGRHETTPNDADTYTFAQTYDSIHNITRKTQTNLFKTSVKPQTTYDYTYIYPASGAPRPHGATAIGTFDITHDANGNHIRTQEQGTSNTEHYTFDEENRLVCANKGQQAPSPSCDAQGETEFTYDHAGVRKRKDASSPTLYPNQTSAAAPAISSSTSSSARRGCCRRRPGRRRTASTGTTTPITWARPRSSPTRTGS